MNPFVPRSRAVTIALLVLLASWAITPAGGQENWPAWRGPRGDGTSLASNLPLTWDVSQGVAWKADLPEWGTSTPAIWQDALFVTTQHDDELLLIALDARSGQTRWTRKVGQASTPREGPKREKQKFHQLHNLASPSPVTDGRTVVVHFGNGDLAAYDFSGELRWRHNLQEEFGAYTIWWGHANSPVLYRQSVISVCMQDSLADLGDKISPSYLVAHDLESGKLVWKSSRMTGAASEQCDAYTTPILVERNGRTELVVMGGNQLDAYDPQNGEQLWFLPGLVGGRTVTGPTAGEGMIFVTRGMRGPLLAIKPAGSGERTSRDIVWKNEKGTPDTPCTVLCNGILFAITDDGIARAFDAHSGNLHWTERLKGNYKASPLAVDQRIYFLNTTGLCTVVSAAARFEKLAENQLPEGTLASPAVAGDHLFIRGRKSLYCLGAPVPSAQR